MKTLILAIIAFLLVFSTDTAPAMSPTQKQVLVYKIPDKAHSEATRSSGVRARTLREYIHLFCKQNCIDPATLTSVAIAAGKEYGLDPSLIIAIVKVESEFNQKAENKKGGYAGGLMQIQVRWHPEKITRKEVFVPKRNIIAGSEILGNCMKKHKGNTRKSLMCYNGYSNTKYPDKVLSARKMVENLTWGT